MTLKQRGGQKDCCRCKDQLMINNAILENCKTKKKNLSAACIGYKKALYSVDTQLPPNVQDLPSTDIMHSKV